MKKISDLLSPVLLISVCAFISGCDALSDNYLTKIFPSQKTIATLIQDIGTPAPHRYSAFYALMDTAQAKEPNTINDPASGAKITLVAGRQYFAASGRTCRRFHVLDNLAFDSISSGLTCKTPAEEWEISKMILNPNSSFLAP